MYYPVCGMVLIKEPLLLIRKSSPCSFSSGFNFISTYLSGPVLYVRHHIAINKMLMGVTNVVVCTILSVGWCI